jgi:hypothetical protein
MRRLFATCVFAVLAACSGLGGELDQRVDGTWIGNSNGVSINMSIIQTGNVTGIATFTGGTTGTHSYAVSGTFKSPTFNASLSGTTPGDTITLDATVTGKSMVGTLTGSGFAGNAIALTRQ